MLNIYANSFLAATRLGDTRTFPGHEERRFRPATRHGEARHRHRG
ncbi:hypothetical protein OB2597_10396 [Pseudooceanicola batsensis HTCC2597]|uniref:Uncharacterized protein n=1 Tax=Pseudooceanicola batsensis (strain ATCC BAA-863 / DSM 15984 / KCTC 12145 / HTCC2597) TaxID=252305 RepID=A3TVJ9_PSEBH|nr:hypothetical protein [Pseudooceanicola batsensis]EAQ03645.1 hypothetical protein OB2597_10396 [Pseudooceanicola batsensis HTCC2597]